VAGHRRVRHGHVQLRCRQRLLQGAARLLGPVGPRALRPTSGRGQAEAASSAWQRLMRARHQS
jgi:hypothetical protein